MDRLDVVDKSVESLFMKVNHLLLCLLKTDDFILELNVALHKGSAHFFLDFLRLISLIIVLLESGGEHFNFFFSNDELGPDHDKLWRHFPRVSQLLRVLEHSLRHAVIHEDLRQVVFLDIKHLTQGSHY